MSRKNMWATRISLDIKRTELGLADSQYLIHGCQNQQVASLAVPGTRRGRRTGQSRGADCCMRK
jgi:hypothetical protein